MTAENEGRLNYSPHVLNTSVNQAPDDLSRELWHQHAIGDTNTSHSFPGRLYVVQCHWCAEAFAAHTKAEAMEMFRQHERAMLDAPAGEVLSFMTDDLTPEVLAETRVAALRSALPDSASEWKLDGDPGIIEALLSGVRSRDARIAELEAEREQAKKSIERWFKKCMTARGEREALKAVVASRGSAIEEAQRILLGGIGQSWARVVDRALLALRGADQ